MTEAPWTEADAAELDVLLDALTRGFMEHRERCTACRPCPQPEAWRLHKAECPRCGGDAPLTFGPACAEKQELVEHNRTCLSCSGPCPHVQAAIREVCDWREARALLSKAQALRRALDELDPEPVVDPDPEPVVFAARVA